MKGAKQMAEKGKVAKPVKVNEDVFDDDDDDIIDDDDIFGDEEPQKRSKSKSGDPTVGDDGAFVINMEDDVDEADAAGPPPVDAGVYNVIVDDLSYGKSQRSGNFMFTWKLRIVGGEFDDRTLMDFHVLFVVAGKNKGIDKRGLAKAKTFIKAMGIDTPLGKFDPAEFAESGAAIGARGRAKVGIQKSDQGKRNVINGMLAAKGGGDGLFDD